MRSRVLHIRERLTSSFWFVPSVMFLLAIVLAFGMVALDRAVIETAEEESWLYNGDAPGARSLLSVVASSVITVAGVVFSITISTLTQASSQFGPRLLRNFMRDRGNQIVLGVFVMTFIYCLLVLRTIRGDGREDDDGIVFVPHASVTIGVVLAVCSFGMLVYFIHHVAVMLQAPHVVANAASDLGSALRRTFPTRLGHDPPEDASSLPPLEQFAMDGAQVRSDDRGYLQGIDAEGIMDLVRKHDLLMNIPHRPGKFITRGTVIAYVAPAARVTDDVCHRVQDAFIVGPQRTAEQDLEFVVNQLVEIAVRALSKGINDPFTANTCIDWLGSALARIARENLCSPYRFDEAGKLRVIAPGSTFQGVCDAAFNQIRQYGRDSAPVMIRMLEVIRDVGPYLRDTSQVAALRRHVEMIYQDGRDQLVQEEDRKDLDARYHAATRELDLAQQRVESSG